MSRSKLINSVAVSLLLLAFACTEKSAVVHSCVGPKMLELESRVVLDEPKTNRILVLDELGPDDILVAVNGYPLRKRTYDDLMLMKARGLMQQKGANQFVAEQQLQAYRSTLIRNFIGQRLMIDHAFAEGVVTTNDMVSFVSKKIEEAAKNRNKSVDAWLKSFPGDTKYLFYEMASAYVMGSLIDNRIPPIAEVTDRLVQGVQESVVRDNNAARATNELIRLRLLDWKRQIVEKKLDFSAVANIYSQEQNNRNPDDGGAWGTFEEPEMDDPALAASIFALKKGEISDPLDDGDAFHLVKVDEIIPPVRNEDGRVIEREKRTLSQIRVEKMPLLLRQDNQAMAEDLKNQFQTRAINMYIANLQTNGQNKVIYPNGRPLYHQ